MPSVELEESIECRGTLYDEAGFEEEYLTLHRITLLPEEERRKQREQDKADFLDWFWLSPLAGGFVGDVGSEELDRLCKFARENGIHPARSRHDHRAVEEAIREAVEDDLLIPVIDRTDDWRGGYMPAGTSSAPALSDELTSAADGLFAGLSGTLSGGEPILSGPYDPSKQEALLKAARSGGAGALSGDDGGSSGGFDWLSAAEAAAGALLGGAAADDDGGDSMLKNLAGGDTGDGGSLFGDAQPFEYVPDVLSDDVMDLAASTNNPNYAAKMLGYDRKTFGDILHKFKPGNGLGPADNVIWHDNGEVYFKGDYIGNFHDWAD